MTKRIAELGQLASTQFGVVTRAQALAVMSSATLSRLVTRGVLVRSGRGVYRFAGVEVSWRQRALAACLAAGERAVLSHLAAGYLWQLPSIAPPQVHLIVPADCHYRPGGEPLLHRIVLRDDDVTRRWRIPVTTPPRTMVDLVPMVKRPLLERVFDDFVRGHHFTVAEFEAFVKHSGRLRGSTRQVLTEMVAARTGRGEGASPREDWAYDAIVMAGLAPPVRRYLLELNGEIREIDLAYPEEKIAIEYDGFDVHHDATHFHRDREKAALLQLDGWIVLQVTKRWTAEVLVARVRRALALRAA